MWHWKRCSWDLEETLPLARQAVIKITAGPELRDLLNRQTNLGAGKSC
jgi:hypothetical protein